MWNRRDCSMILNGVGKLYSGVRILYGDGVGILYTFCPDNRRGSHSSMKSSMALKKFEV